MGIKLFFFVVLTATLYGFVPVSKTYYSDHTHIKYLPWLIFAGKNSQKREFLRKIEHVRDDMYTRELYRRNYHRFYKNPICTVDGEETIFTFDNISDYRTWKETDNT